MSAPPPPFGSPMQPVAPPSKKMKAEGVNSDADSAHARRRQELQRLRERTGDKRTPGGTKVQASRTEGLLAQARSQLEGPPAGLPPYSRSSAKPPPGAPIDRVRQNDIFPSVQPKISSRAPPPHPPARPNGAVPTSDRGNVARRLEFPQGRVSPAPVSGRVSPAPGRSSPALPGARAKSAPPSRPPPPPGPPPASKEAPESTPTRGYSSRPPPVTPGPPGSSLKGPPKPVETPKMSSAPAPAPTPIPVPSPAPQPVMTPGRPPSPALASSKPPATPPMSFSAGSSVKAPETVAQTKAPAADGPPPTTTRKDMLRNLHQYADTPAKPETAPKEEADQTTYLLRLEKEMKEKEKEKAETLRKVAIMEDQLQKMKEQPNLGEALTTVVQMAERDGEAAAIQYAKQRVSGLTPKSPMQVRRSSMIVRIVLVVSFCNIISNNGCPFRWVFSLLEVLDSLPLRAGPTFESE